MKLTKIYTKKALKGVSPKLRGMKTNPKGVLGKFMYNIFAKVSISILMKVSAEDKMQ